MRPELIARHYAPDAALPTSAIPTLLIADELADMRDAFAVLGDWTERYQYIIDLGRRLPPLSSQFCTEAHRLHGCQSQVWLVLVPQGGRLFIYAASDALIVSGLIALIARVYNGRTPAEILAQDAGFVADLGLGDHISQGRKNGLAALVEAIHTVAAHMQRHNNVGEVA
jgi:cysteine desulfuration protein SufE